VSDLIPVVLAALDRHSGQTLDACQLAEELGSLPTTMAKTLATLAAQHRVVAFPHPWRATRYRAR
jgi:hypothetical protein